MRTFLALALALAAAGELQAQTAPLGPAAGCRCEPAARRNYGMDWKGEAYRPDLGRLVPRLESFLDDWAIMPKRMIDAFWWGGAFAATSVILGVEAVLLFLWFLVRKT